MAELIGFSALSTRNIPMVLDKTALSFSHALRAHQEAMMSPEFARKCLYNEKIIIVA